MRQDHTFGSLRWHATAVAADGKTVEANHRFRLATVDGGIGANDRIANRQILIIQGFVEKSMLAIGGGHPFGTAPLAEVDTLLLVGVELAKDSRVATVQAIHGNFH